VAFADSVFMPGKETKVVEKVNARDEDRILRSIRNATKQADFVIVMSHSHEPSEELLTPPTFLVEFIKKCIDAGADAFIVHGPHQLRGIEIYKEKPIFYSLGNFIFQNETSDNLPSDLYELYALGEEELPADLMNARYKFPQVRYGMKASWRSHPSGGTNSTSFDSILIDLGQKAPVSRNLKCNPEGIVAQF
jgi:hypothetical protein